MVNTNNVVVGVSNCLISQKTGRILLGKRKSDGMYGSPGGHVEPFETIIQAAVRETVEETKLDIQNLNTDDNIRLIGCLYNTIKSPVSMGFVVVTDIDNESSVAVHDTEEMTDWGWYDPYGKLPLLYYPTTQTINFIFYGTVDDGWHMIETKQP